jgi:CDP-glucose 4,6-dehydratase
MEGMGVTPSFWRGRRVLLTGHTGFKGAWLAMWLDAMGADVSAFALAPESEALWSRFSPSPLKNVALIDICDREAVLAHVREARPEIVLHLAAQAIVRRSYQHPAATYATNIQGTTNLIESLLRTDALRALLVVTSDKVYAGAPADSGFSEQDPLGGVDPYSASKAACELVVASFAEAVLRPRGIAVATTRAGNIVGGGDMGDDRIVPDIVRAVHSTRALRLRAPGALRPWQHVLDALSGYLMLAELMINRPQHAPTALNFGPGPDSRRCVREVVEATCAAWDVELKIEMDTAMPVEPKPLWLNSTLAREKLGWRPRLNFDATIRWTVDWWRDLAAGHSARSACSRQIDAYAEMAQSP